MNIVSDQFINQSGDAGMSIDITDPATACYAGAAVVGATVVVGSVGLTTMAAPVVTLVPAAAAVGLYVVGDRMRDARQTPSDTDNAPVGA